MSTAEDIELSGWADQDGVTKSALLHDMIGRERKRRILQGRYGTEIDMIAGYTETSLLGGKIWRGDNLAGTDAGYTRVKEFIERYSHDDWTLSIYNALDESTAEINCSVEDIPEIVSFVYNLEHAYPMTFIGESPSSKSYVIGMTLTRGRIQTPGVYRAENGKLHSVLPSNLA
ncbi:hypothetical protein [Adlercreutzia sp. ZJ473]|uniref:hypothetical protein n=1 Tax=Adlercreutzia sp. ZJ473 TaxID=2722822 RepID=UPI0015545D20|nr:hypothetical protein [Adlercreutzia sp. ZJ473]